jgi:signal peptidase I
MGLDTNKLWRDSRSFILFVMVMLVFRSAIADWNQVPSGSMYPSIFIGDRIVVDKLAYDLRIPFTLHRLARLHEPQRGDVVTFQSPVDERLLVKRVIGIPGDTIELADNHLSVNDQSARYVPLTPGEIRQLPLTDTHRYDFFRESVQGNERLVMFLRSHAGYDNSIARITVPDNHYLVLGDNRDNSQDSRAIGFVQRDLILGKAESVAFSLDYDHYYQPRLDRFFTALP